MYNLDQTFIHKTATHEFHIQWTRVGENTAPTLVFIHGTPWSSGEWHDLAASLSSRYNIYLYDHPGFGDSPSPQRLERAGTDDKADLDGPLKVRAEASAALLKHWNISNPHVVAHDNGGLVSLRLLLQHGIEFASLCLIDVVTSGSTKLPFFKLVTENEKVFTAIPPHLIEGFVRAYVKNATYKPMAKEVEDMLCAPWLAGGSQGVHRFLQEMIQANDRDASDVEKDYASVGRRTPTKIIWGKDDAWVPVDAAHRLQKAVNAEELVVIEDAGHLVQFDQPSKLALEVGLWLNRHDKNEA